MPSYLEKEQLIPIKPHIAPIDAIVNTFNTRLQSWGYAAASLKSTSNSYAGLDLTREDNQAEHSSLMNEANKKIGASAQTDLTISDNRMDAMKAFDPINKNQDIMGDHANTVKWDAERQKAEAARTKDGGKYYNQASVDAINYQQALFKSIPKKIATKDGSTVDSWKLFLANSDTYTPYYDKTAELLKLQEAFKTDIIDTTQPLGNGYMLRSKNASWDKDKWQAFVESNASPQLKQQLAVEAKAEFRKSLLLGGPEETFKAYNNQLATMNQSKIEFYANKLADAKLAKLSLSKNARDYDERLAEYNGIINKIEGSKDAPGFLQKLKENQLDSNVFSYENMQRGESIATELHKADYFDRAGSNFAHKDIVQEFKMDGAFYANKQLEVDYARLKQDASQHADMMNYRYKSLRQEKSLAELRIEAQYKIAGMKLDAKGNPVFDIATYPTTALDANGKSIPATELGKQKWQMFQDGLAVGYSSSYNTLQGEYFGNQSFIDNMGKVDGSTPFHQIRSQGGGGEDEVNNVVDFIANAYWGKGIYKSFGIDTSNPVAAKEALKSKLRNQPVATVKKWLNMAFDQPDMIRTAVNKAATGQKGMAVAVQAEILKKDMDGARKSWDEAYGPTVNNTLAKLGYPKRVQPGSELWNAGIRGTQQEGDGIYRIPTDDEIEAFGTTMDRTKMDMPFTNDGNMKAQFKTYYEDLKSKKQTPSDVAPKLMFGEEKDALKRVQSIFDKAKSSDEFVELMYDNELTKRGFISSAKLAKDNLYRVLGEAGAPAMNVSAGTFSVNEKNRDVAKQRIDSFGDNLTNENDSDAKKLISLARRYPDAVESIRYFTGAKEGQATIGITLDKKKLETDDQNELPSNHTDIRIQTTSPDIPMKFKTRDLRYLDALELTKKHEVDFPDKPPITIKLANMGTWEQPNFQMEGEFYEPVIEKGNFVYENGKVKLEKRGPMDFQMMITNLAGGNLEKVINANPTIMLSSAVNRVYALRELIRYVNQNKPKTTLEIPASFQAELNKLTQ